MHSAREQACPRVPPPEQSARQISGDSGNADRRQAIAAYLCGDDPAGTADTAGPRTLDFSLELPPSPDVAGATDAELFALDATVIAQPAKSLSRKTVAGSTSFRALCNSYLRKFLRGAEPESLYWVAMAVLPNGNRVLARLRVTVTVEEFCVENDTDIQSSCAIEYIVARPVQALAIVPDLSRTLRASVPA